MSCSCHAVLTTEMSPVTVIQQQVVCASVGVGVCARGCVCVGVGVCGCGCAVCVCEGVCEGVGVCVCVGVGVCKCDECGYKIRDIR